MQMSSGLRKSHNTGVPHPVVGRNKLLLVGGTRSTESEHPSLASRGDLEAC